MILEITKTVKLAACDHKFGKYRWDGHVLRLLWFVKLKQNLLCRRGNIFVLITYYFKTTIYFIGQKVILSPDLDCYLFCLQYIYL